MKVSNSLKILAVLSTFREMSIPSFARRSLDAEKKPDGDFFFQCKRPYVRLETVLYFWTPHIVMVVLNRSIRLKEELPNRSRFLVKPDVIFQNYAVQKV